MKKLLILLFALGALVAGLTGCRTAHGAGEDLESVGETIQENTDR